LNFAESLSKFVIPRLLIGEPFKKQTLRGLDSHQLFDIKKTHMNYCD